MPKAEFSSLALSDLKGISRYTVRIWGADQATRYVDEIQACIQQIAEQPSMGRKCSALKSGYHSLEQGRHVIFYYQRAGTVIFSRILHQRMLPKKHRLE